jgi:hypothetical protein
MIINLESHATAAVSGQSRAEARGGIALAPVDAAGATGLEAAAFTTGLPTDAQALTLFAGNGAIRNHFNIATDSIPGATSDIFGLATMGGSNTEGGTAASRIFTSSLTYSIDLASLTNARQNLLVGLLDTNVEGNGFDTLNFQVSREGAIVVNETFMTSAAAVTYFDTKVLDLGSNGVANVSGNLDLIFTLTLTTNDAAAGFYFDMAFGNSTLNTARPPGDYDRNGIVNAADYAVWSAAYGAIGANDADGNGNGVVDAADYTIWRNNLGAGSPGSFIGSADVPEPSTFLILLIGWGMLFSARRNRRALSRFF